MKLKVLVGAVVAMIAVPAPAQISNTDKLVKAVADRDGPTAHSVLGTSGPAILNDRDSSGDTALMIAISRRDDMWTRFLLQRGADPNFADGDGALPLIAAARIGWTDAVEWLLEEGAEVDGTNRMNETALIVAVQQRRGPIVERLLAAGADPDRPDSAAGYTARDYAKRDTRSRRMLELIEAADKKPQEVTDIDDFKLE